MLAKRLLDLCLTVPGIILLSPLLLAIALWIKLGSDGPVLFRQVRVGLHGQPFSILKFRTMVTQAESLGPKLTSRDDPRITTSGRFLRRYKLDELPQLFNVLKGEMSLVGPRPEVPEYIVHYPVEISEEVLSVRPGLTDYAAIEYRNENDLLDASDDPQSTYINQILPQKWALYLKYIRNRSLMEDIRIMLRTIRAMF